MTLSLTASAALSVSSDWGSGFVGTITIRNDGASPVSGWTLEFPFAHRIDSLWNGRIVGRPDGGYVIQDAGWNATIAPGASISFGFVATTNGTIAPPSTWLLNGEAVGWGGALPWLSVADTRIVEGDSATGRFAELLLRLSAPSTGEVAVDFQTAGQSAAAGYDFQPTSGTVRFAPGEVEKVVRVPILGDTAVESDEQFLVQFANPRGVTLIDGRSVVTIANDDSTPIPGISVADVAVAEGAAGAGGTATFVVRLSNAYTAPVAVNFATADGSATLADGDYTATSGRLVFAPGETAKSVTVAIAGDGRIEGDETVRLILSNPSNGTLADGDAVATIRNDDELPRLSVGDVELPEGDGPGTVRVTVTLSNAWAEPVTVSFASSVGTALPGHDYESVTGSITFAPGETAKVVEIPLIGDQVLEAREYFFLNISDPVNATIQDGQGVIWLRNDDAPTVSVSDATVTEGNDGTVLASFTVSLADSWTAPVSVDFTTADGTATVADGDYQALAGSVTFAPGETSKTITVVVAGDTKVEPDEGFRLLLSNPVNTSIADGEGAGRIVSDDQLPGVTITDLSMPEGNGPGVARLTVTLSHAWGGAVQVGYATADGSARGGSDFTAASGTLTFAPGETTKVIEVAVLGDTAGEQTESFTVNLTDPVNATIADAAATVTLTNDDQPTVSVSIAHSSVAESNPGALNGGGFFSVSGSQIVDDRGQSVRINGINWGGFQETVNAPFGIWARPWKDLMNQMKALGFNTIRLPFSSDTLSPDAVAQPHAWLNPDLAGLSPLEIMDKVVEYAGQIGLRIILDRHRAESGGGADENGNGLWYYGEYTEERWINDWKMLAQRYAGNPTVIGADLHNEPIGYAPHRPELGLAGWGNEGPTDWRLAAERAGNAILEVNPDWLIFVEGNSTFQDNWYFWGGNLMGADQYPVRLSDPSKLVYSPHVYYRGPEYYAPNTQFQDFQKFWGYLHEQDRGAIMVGEFGSRLQNEDQVQWMQRLVQYMNGDYDGDGVSDLEPGEQGVSFTYWDFGPASHDTGGILSDDWQTPIQQKMDIIRPGMIDLPNVAVGGGPATVTLTFAVSLSSAVPLSTNPADFVTVQYRTVAGTATEGLDYLGQSGTLEFRGGELVKLVQVQVLADLIDEADETVGLEIFNASGASLGTVTAVGVITDNDPGLMG